MTLSVVIVNYNVKYFLEQCLKSVFAAKTEGFELEVFVVDNNSVDDSVAMVRERFPQVKVIANDENVGFAKANNQALKLCTGDGGARHLRKMCQLHGATPRLRRIGSEDD